MMPTVPQDASAQAPPAAKTKLFPMWTGRSDVPWIWVVLFAYPCFSNTLMESISGVALTFTMKKFVSDPALITFLGSINIAFNFLVAPWAAWKSDHIWTPIGRRRPFLIFGWSLLFLSIVLVPFAPSLPLLALCIVIYQFCADIGYVGPWTPLYYEMIPSHQRGRAVVIKRIGAVISRLLFNFLLIGQFDHIYNLNWSLGLAPGSTFRLTGEMVIYWSGGLAVLLVVLQMIFLVREKKPDVLPVATKFSPLRYVVELFGERQWRLLFLLMFCSLALTAGLGQLYPLLITEQFGYSKALFGQMWTVNYIVEICLLPIAFFIVDRLDRFRVFQIGLVLSTAQHLAFWLFVEYVAPNHLPTPAQIIFFNLWNSAVDVVAGLALEPLIFDFVPRNKMGTLNSGFLFVRGALALLVFNGVGLWVKFFSQLFRRDGHFDYMSGYLFTFLVGLVGIGATWYFASQLKKGSLIMYGKLEEKAAAEHGL